MNDDTNPLNKGSNDDLLVGYQYTNGETIVIPVYTCAVKELEIEFNTSGSTTTGTTTSGILDDIDYTHDIDDVVPNNLAIIGFIPPRTLEHARNLKAVEKAIVARGGLSGKEIEECGGPREATRILEERVKTLGDTTR